MPDKICTKCGLEKSFEDYHNNKKSKDGKFWDCKSCVIAGQKAYYAKYPERLKENRRTSQRRRRTHRKKYLDRYYSLEANKQKRREAVRRHRKKKGYSPPNSRQRTKRNLMRRLNHILRARYQSTMVKYLGCSGEELNRHLESLWSPGMTWDNYGLWRSGEPMTWHIDHIIPCAAFNFAKEEDIAKCFHYSNLQPLWAIDNFKKWKSLPDSA